MGFYDALQLDPAGLKQKIRNAQQSGEKRKMIAAIVVRSVLLVLFSTVMISPAASIFGQENSCMAVALLCILLGIRFVDFGYRIGDSLAALALAFALLLAAPAAAAAVPPVFGILIHTAALFVILYLTSQKPEMGNAGLYTFSYIYLAGNPVSGVLLEKRALLTLLGWILCGSILYAKHRRKNQNVHITEIIKKFRFSDPIICWQIQLALGVGILLGLGSWLNIRRMMWAAFACSSILGCYSPNPAQVKERFNQRMAGTLIGTLAFFVLYQILPTEIQGMVGILGGLLVGFCTEYRYKTACNALGALLVASGAYGLGQSVFLRIFQNLTGVIFACLFLVVFQKLTQRYRADSLQAEG